METGKINMTGIRNVILDLGGVILELDVDATIQAFVGLGFPPLQSADIILSKYPFFLEFETGQLSSDDFIEKVMEISGNNISRQEILEAWNAMSLGFRADSIELVMRLREKYRLFLLSNTNAIHEIYYNDQLKQQHGIVNLDRIFEKVYYSHKLKMRKPDTEIFRYVLKDAGLIPEESLYIDDTIDHIETAGSLGIRAYHLAPPQRITEVL
ncbi:HAD family hydrolase [Bacteroidota bacterium]